MTIIVDVTPAPDEAPFGGFVYQLDAFAGPINRHDRSYARPQGGGCSLRSMAAGSATATFTSRMAISVWARG